MTTPFPSILIVGNSHIECLAAAAQAENLENVDFVNLTRITRQEDVSDSKVRAFVTGQAKIAKPDVLCLCVKGNQHNIFGIVENPQPFSVGDAQAGAVPPTKGKRSFVSFNLMVENFEDSFDPAQIALVYDIFPDAARIYFNAPPPISSWSHIEANPRLFADKLHLGPAPKALRMQLYRAQTRALQNIAASCKAKFVEPAPEVHDGEGFLAERFYGQDPTHANAAYGAIMLKKLMTEAQDMLAMGEAK